LLEAEARRARACLYGLASVAMLWALAFTASIAVAQEPTPRQWDSEVAGTLLAYIERLESHGLEPGDYAPAELERAIASGDSQAIERQATASFASVASDLALGRLRPGQRGRFFIASDTLDPMKIARDIDTAIALRSVAHVLEDLAPRHREYAALRRALAKLTPERIEERRKIAVNLERWRWMPRALGSRHLLVNIPEYRARLFDDGAETASHRVIVGAPRTPTPQFSAEATGVILNPPWNVPQSIVAESVGRLVRNSPAVARARGYTWRTDASGNLRVTQGPGPQNALGQMKIDMPNSFSVFLHDTPNKDLFEREARTLSHGCIRTQAPLDLAANLLADAGWSRSAIDEAVAARRTRRVPLSAPVPVHIVYLTAFAGTDGTVRNFDDPYRLDAAIYARLKDGS
jgi:L,D-transpeptidase YcbB